MWEEKGRPGNKGGKGADGLFLDEQGRERERAQAKEGREQEKRKKER